MRLIKKIAVFLLLTALILTSTVSYAGYNHLEAIGITNEKLPDKAQEDLITRAEFCYLVSGLLTQQPIEKSNTQFADVDAKNIYSGAIDLLAKSGIVNGVNDTQFKPDDNISRDAAVKIILDILGYRTVAEKIGGFPSGYKKISEKLSLNKNLKPNRDFLTKEDAFTILNNALLSRDMMGGNIEYTDNGLSLIIGENQSNFLTGTLHFSVYRGKIESVNVKSGDINFFVEKNEFRSNYKPLKEKSYESFKATDGIDINHFEDASVMIWVNSEDEIVNIELLNNCEILYGYADSVNRDSNPTHSYDVNAIRRITIRDREKEYSVADNVSIEFNGKKSTEDVNLCQNFVKLVIINDKVTDIKGWNLKKCGIIKNIDLKNGEITYQSEGVSLRKIKDLNQKGYLMVNIDGESREFSEIKTESVFCIYENDEMAVIAVSERTATGNLSRITEDEIRLDNITFYKNDCFYSIDGKEYKSNNALDLLGSDVTVYFGPDGYVYFIRSESFPREKNEFYGVMKIFDDESIPDEKKITLIIIGDEIKEDSFTLTDKTRYKDELSEEILKSSVKKIDGSGLFYFTINKKKEVKEVRKCNPFNGYGAETKVNVSSFVNDAIAYVAIGDKMLYFTDTPIVGICEKEGKFTVQRVEWSNILNNRISGNVTMSFYSEEETPEPQLAVLTGDLPGLGKVILESGIITNIEDVLDEDDCVNTYATIVGRTGTKDYKLTPYQKDVLYKNDFITFYSGRAFSDAEIVIKSVYNFNEDTDSWQTDKEPYYGMHKGIVRKIDDKRIYFEGSEEDIWYMHPNLCYILTADGNGKRRIFEKSSVTDIYAGDTVFYYLNGGDIKAVICIK